MTQATTVLVFLIKRIQEIDIGILKYIYENRFPVLDSAFIYITDTAAVLAFGIPGILFLFSLIKKKEQLRSKALYVLISIVLSALVANILKYTIDLPRPFEVYPFIEKLSKGGSPSFPSGHTADAFAFAVSASIIYSRKYIIIPIFIWAFLVGYSRICLGVHFPSDVLVGALIGALCAYFYSRVLKMRQ